LTIAREVPVLEPSNTAERRNGFRLKRKVVASHILDDLGTPADGEPRPE
jgi:hypothetical protein